MSDIYIQNPASTLIANIGSFWSQFFTQNDQLKTIVDAGIEENEQTILAMAEAVASVSRFNIPVFKREIWKKLVIDRQTLLRVNQFPFVYGQSGLVYGTGAVYGQYLQNGKWKIPLPTNVVNVQAIVDNPVSPNVIWVNGTDFTIVDGFIETSTDPFEAGFTVKTEMDINGNDVPVLGMWLNNSDLDLKYVYNNFGYVVGLYASESSENYKNLVNAVFDTLMKGSNSLSCRVALASLFNIPVVKSNNETVVTIVSTNLSVTITTDVNTYTYPSTANAIIAVGDVVNAGDFLTDDVEIYEGNSLDQVDASALVMEPGFFGSSISGALVFDNNYHATTYEVDSDGFVKVTFPIGGNPADVQKLWDHAYTYAKSTGTVSVAQALRLNSYAGQPQQIEVAGSVNPMKFLINEFLKDNLVIINLKVYNSKLIENASKLLFIRKLLPAHIALLFNIEVAFDDEQVPDASDNWDSSNGWPIPGANFFNLIDPGSYNWQESYNSTSIVEIVETVIIM